MSKLAIVFPERDRPKDIESVLPALSHYLDSHKVSYQYFIITQSNSHLFNRGALLNIGFDIVRQLNYDNVCFHDIDMVPTHNCNYSYTDGIRHLSRVINGKEMYKRYIGGVLLMHRKCFEMVDGFCNYFEGWGVEDDNLYKRIMRAGMKVTHHPGEFYATEYPRDTSNYGVNMELLDVVGHGLSELRYEKQLGKINNIFTYAIQSYSQIPNGFRFFVDFHTFTSSITQNYIKKTSRRLDFLELYDTVQWFK